MCKKTWPSPCSLLLVPQLDLLQSLDLQPARLEKVWWVGAWRRCREAGGGLNWAAHVEGLL